MLSTTNGEKASAESYNKKFHQKFLKISMQTGKWQCLSDLFCDRQLDIELCGVVLRRLEFNAILPIVMRVMNLLFEVNYLVL